MSEFLHVIAFDIPYPPNYGGAIDVFFRIKSLTENGVNVILHCFEYNREKSEVLEKLCFKVFYYKRNTSLLSHFSILPYTVISRKNKQLYANLLNDNYPILFDGLMSCYYLNDKAFAGRTKIYREANIEHHYYAELFKATALSFSKLYYLVESLKFRFFERNLKHSNLILAISEIDKSYYVAKFPSIPVAFIPCFHSNVTVNISAELGNYVLYHGNLSVAENVKAVAYLCEHVFAKLNCRCVVAGMNPTEQLQQLCAYYPMVELVANPSDLELKKLVRDAQVHTLVTFQSTGLKIKLLNTLFAGKHVLVNETMLAGSGLNSLCTIANTPFELVDACNRLMNLPFSDAAIAQREQILLPHFSNNYLAAQVISLIANLD